MEMELMVKESVTGSNKSKGDNLEANMEEGEGRWKLSTRRSD